MTDESTEEVLDSASKEKTEEKGDRNAEQLEKLAKSNQELKEERDRAQKEAEEAKLEREKYKKLYENPTNVAPQAQQFPNLNPQQIQQTFKSMVDENGFLDGNKLTEVLTGLDQRARQAEERAQRAEQLAQTTTKKTQEKQEKEAQNKVYEKYPQLNPDNKEGFDPKMWRAVYNELATKATRGEEPTEDDYMKSADQVYNDFYKDREEDMKKKEEGKKTEEKKEEVVEQKQQASSIRPSSTIQTGYYKDAEEKDLLIKAQHGQRGSVAELLRRRGQ